MLLHCGDSILLHSGLNAASHFWFQIRYSCCLKMKSVENISGYIREQFYRFSRGCMLTDSFLGNKESSLNHAKGYFVAFLGDISTLSQAEI